MLLTSVTFHFQQRLAPLRVGHEPDQRITAADSICLAGALRVQIPTLVRQVAHK